MFKFILTSLMYSRNLESLYAYFAYFVELKNHINRPYCRPKFEKYQQNSKINKYFAFINTKNNYNIVLYNVILV